MMMERVYFTKKILLSELYNVIMKLKRWSKLKLIEQLANIGDEVHNAIKWRNKNNLVYFKFAISRALTLLNLMINDTKNKNRLKEVVIIYNVLLDYFYGENIYKSSDELWQKYFYNFAYAVRRKII